MKNLLFAACLSLLFFAACQPGKNQKKDDFSASFTVLTPADTLRFEIAQSDETLPGDTLQNAKFLSQVDAKLMQGIDFLDNSDEAVFIGRSRFTLAEGVEAYLVDIHQNWFKNQSLFLFDKKNQRFADRLTVAEWFGGEGGQILTGSWLLDYDKDGGKDLVRREIEHWLLMGEDEPRDTFQHRAELLLWKNGQFTKTAGVDSTTLITRFPIASAWE